MEIKSVPQASQTFETVLDGGKSPSSPNKIELAAVNYSDIDDNNLSDDGVKVITRRKITEDGVDYTVPMNETKNREYIDHQDRKLSMRSDAESDDGENKDVKLELIKNEEYKPRDGNKSNNDTSYQQTAGL